MVFKTVSRSLLILLNSGRVIVDGDVALVTQQAWIQNTTLRNNILYGSDYNHDR